MLLIGTVLLPAQQDPTTGEVTIRETVTNVVAPTTVIDTDGSYVSGIKPHEFQLYDNDKLQNINVAETFAPISLVVAIQADAKVEAVLPKIQKIGPLLNTMVAGDGGEVAIVAFDHRIQRLQDFTNDTNKLQEALKKLRPGSSQARMTDALIDSVRMLRSRPPDRRRVVMLIAESRDKGSENKVREGLVQTQFADVLVYGVNISRVVTEITANPPVPRPDPIPPGGRHVPAGAPITPTAVAQMTGRDGYAANFAPLITEIFRQVKGVFVDNPVEVFTKYTGGREIGFTSQRDLERAVADIGREIHNQYMIAYNPNDRSEGGFHTIRVVVNRPGLTVRTRPGYWMAGTPQ